MKRYVVIRERDGERMSIPADYRVAVGIHKYLSAVTRKETYHLVEVQDQ